MNQDFSELIQYLNGKFTHIDKRFDEMKKKSGLNKLQRNSE